MKKRLLSLTLALALAASLLTIPAFADLPKGYWPVWSAYTAAVESGDEAAILQKGDAVIQFYSKYERNADIANQLFVIYRTRLERLIYENRGDWANAAANTRALRDICTYQISIGNDPAAYAEWLPRCDAHLAVVEPFTGVYAASYAQSKAYGSRIAPASGTLYGTPFEGCYEDSSIVSFYVEMENETAQTYSHYIDRKADGKRVILLNLNFKGEGSTARAIPSGKYDSSLRTTFGYLATLKSPVLVRIGAEANVWTDSVTPADFIAAYNYVAHMARSLAPQAELVWSPNCASAWGVNTADFYPDSNLVDWVGLSLYYNYDNAGGTRTDWLEFIHAGKFADPIANAEEVVKIARAKNKPVIVTEGGAVDTSAVPNYKADKTAKEFAQLTMAYPEVKAIIHFDKSINGNDYRLTGSAKAAVDAAIAANPTLIPYGESSAATYIPVTQLNERMSGTLELGATGRTYASTDMSAAWTLDGKQASNSARYSVELSSLSSGAHKLEVRLSDGGKTTVTKTYTLDYTNGTVKITEGYTAPAAPAQPATPAPAAKPHVVLSPQKLAVNGAPVATEMYNIDNTNYFKLRDLAAMLDGTANQFNVDFDAARNVIVVTTGVPYTTANGYELQTGADNSGSARASAQSLEIDGREVTDLSVYNIGNTNFFGLRSLEDYLGYEVGYNGATNTATITSK